MAQFDVVSTEPIGDAFGASGTTGVGVGSVEGSTGATLAPFKGAVDTASAEHPVNVPTAKNAAIKANERLILTPNLIICCFDGHALR